jgi:glycosyltransferase involved in cell wall biosynthesis
MLAGCLPVVSSAGALPEVVGDAGVVLESAAPDAREVADGVSRALAQGDDARVRARDRILDRFPLEARGVALERIVEEALSARVRG